MHDLLRCLGHAQDEEGDQGDSDLNAHCVFGNADEALDSQGLLDPAEDQFDLPALFVKVGNLLRRCVEVIGNDAQHLAGIDDRPDLADRHLHRVVAALREPSRQMTDAVAEHIAVWGRGSRAPR